MVLVMLYISISRPRFFFFFFGKYFLPLKLIEGTVRFSYFFARTRCCCDTVTIGITQSNELKLQMTNLENETKENKKSKMNVGGKKEHKFTNETKKTTTISNITNKSINSSSAPSIGTPQFPFPFLTLFQIKLLPTPIIKTLANPTVNPISIAL